MGLSMTGRAEVSKPTRCNWCGRKTQDLVKIHSHEDKSTLRICTKHWNLMASKPRDWDLWVAVAFPKWDKKVYHKNREMFLIEAKDFIKTEQQVEKIFGGSRREYGKGNRGEV